MLLIRPLRRKELERPGKGLTFGVFDDGQEIGRLVSAEGRIAIRDKSYAIKSVGNDPTALEILGNLAKGRGLEQWSKPDVLKDANDTAIAAAERIGRRSYTVTHHGEAFRFERAGFVSSTWRLFPQTGDAPEGSIVRQGWYGVTCTIEMPDRLDRAIQVFLFWLRYQWELQASVTSYG